MEQLDDLTAGLEGLTDEQRVELQQRLIHTANTTKAEYIEAKRIEGLKQRYSEEMSHLPQHLSNYQRVKLITGIKAKYRAQGLEVW